jgi:cytochrome c oxidase assembly factor 2
MPGMEPGTQKKRRRRKVGNEDEVQKEEGHGLPRDQSPLMDLRKRECPVPKPSGLVGQLLGFEKRAGDPLPAVKVEKFVGRIRKDQGKGNNT